MLVSYSQNFEDIMLYRALQNSDERFYIDIGAWDPDKDSVTKLFYERGWSGINIEPSRTYFRKIERKRPRDINLNVAVGGSPGELDFVEIPGSGLSSLKEDALIRAKKFGFEVKKYRVSVKTLMSIVADHCAKAGVAFLKIDVEGLEKEIIESVDWTSFRPLIVVVEAIHPDTGAPTWESWEKTLLESRYKSVWFDGLNKFYLREESSSLAKHFACPPSLVDGFFLAPGHRFILPNFVRFRVFLRRFLPVNIYQFMKKVYLFLKKFR